MTSVEYEKRLNFNWCDLLEREFAKKNRFLSYLYIFFGLVFQNWFQFVAFKAMLVKSKIKEFWWFYCVLNTQRPVKAYALILFFLTSVSCFQAIKQHLEQIWLHHCYTYTQDKSVVHIISF